jgi:hypothetical protein
MKVSGTSGVGQAQGGSRPRGVGGGAGFHVDLAGGASGPVQAARTAGVAGVMGMDALLALQDVGGPLERRRRAVRRAGRLLDLLDEMKTGLLDGGLQAASLDRLARAIREERGPTDDPKLEGVLDEIETRAAVELAKLEQARRAA